MELITQYWHQIVFIVGLVVVGVKLTAQVHSLQKDLDTLTRDLNRRDTYVETVKLRTEIDSLKKEVTGLWSFCDKLRDKLNGTS
jgi:uncharacterized protein YoxC